MSMFIRKYFISDQVVDHTKAQLSLSVFISFSYPMFYHATFMSFVVPANLCIKISNDKQDVVLERY